MTQPIFSSPKWRDPSTSEFPTAGVASSSAAALMRAPRLGDIEQFNSTETQTENNAVVAGGGSNTAADDDWDSITAEFGLRQFMEAETQFDIDDILCSNYTQTRYLYYVSTYGYGSEKIGLVYASLGNVTQLQLLDRMAFEVRIQILSDFLNVRSLCKHCRSSPILLEAMEEEPPNSAASFLPASTSSTQTLFKEQESSASSKHMETQTG